MRACVTAAEHQDSPGGLRPRVILGVRGQEDAGASRAAPSDAGRSFRL